ncbi:hypothetical protein MKW98_007619 [Papaver atlanticum]|uniref:Uncharacterized protein n=1 Tax=Papaver atlanticum TaxID=357466 RepID=A0AAD4XE18_9MAGN|nr:hypothetical protein MKW98_007619 [Papaver atlanticum]
MLAGKCGCLASISVGVLGITVVINEGRPWLNSMQLFEYDPSSCGGCSKNSGLGPLIIYLLVTHIQTS